MTKRKHFKKIVRDYAAEHNMSYQAALQKLLSEEPTDEERSKNQAAQGRSGVRSGGVGQDTGK